MAKASYQALPSETNRQWAAMNVKPLPDVPVSEKRHNLSSKNRPSRWKRFTYLAFSSNKWGLPIFSWVISMVILLGIVLTLKEWNGRPIQDWHSSISLNALVSLLATVFYLCLRMPISSCIGQLKWNHFADGKRPLHDFYIFDEAGRNVMGAFWFIIRKPLRILGTTAAFLTIAITAVGPFIQQVIFVGVSQEYHNVSGSSVPVTKNFTEENGVLWGSPLTPSYTAIYSGFIPERRLDFSSMASCASANCTWGTYFTLSARSQCANVTDKVTQTGTFPRTAFVLPNGHQMLSDVIHGSSSALMNMSSSFPSMVFANQSGVLVGFSVIRTRTEFSAIRLPEAWDCILQIVGQHYKANTIEGIHKEEAVGEPVTPTTCNAWPYQTIKRPTPEPSVTSATIDLPSKNGTSGWCSNGLTDYDFGFGTCFNSWYCRKDLVYNISSDITGDTLVFNGTSVDTLANKLRGLFNGTAWALSQAQRLSLQVGSVQDSLMTQIDGAAANFTISQRMDNVARSFSNYLRSATLRSDPALVRFAQGTSVDQVPIYIVTWAWITLPAMLLVISFILLLMTIVDTRRHRLPVWSSSSMATLAHGVEDDTKQDLISADSVGGLQNASKEVYVQYDHRSQVLQRKA